MDGGEGGIRSRRSLPHQRFKPDPKLSNRQIHSKPEYQVQNRYSAIRSLGITSLSPGARRARGPTSGTSRSPPLAAGADSDATLESMRIPVPSGNGERGSRRPPRSLVLTVAHMACATAHRDRAAPGLSRTRLLRGFVECHRHSRSRLINGHGRPVVPDGHGSTDVIARSHLDRRLFLRAIGWALCLSDIRPFRCSIAATGGRSPCARASPPRRAASPTPDRPADCAAHRARAAE
jgi:hypothetical protein